MKRMVCALLLMSSSAIAAPTLLSDPWALTAPDGKVALQPDSCKAVETNGSFRQLTLVVHESGGKQIVEDLASSPNGTYTWTITCRNEQENVESTSVDFTFTLPVTSKILDAPRNLRLQ